MIVHRQPTGRQIVEGNDFVAEAQQVICEMTADESCPTGHEISHRVCCCNGSDLAEATFTEYPNGNLLVGKHLMQIAGP